MKTHEAATGKEIMSDSVAGGIAGAGLGGLTAFGVTDASLRGARRSRNGAVRALGRAKGFRTAASSLAGMAGAGLGGAAGSMMMGGHTWFQGVPKEASLKMADLMAAIMKGKPAAFSGGPKASDAVDVIGKFKGSVSAVKKPAGKLLRMSGAIKTAGVIPSFDVLPVKGGALARSVKPATIAKNVKSMHAMPAKIAGALSTVIREADVLIPGVASMGQQKKTKGVKPMPKIAFVKKTAEQRDGDIVQESLSTGGRLGAMAGGAMASGFGAGVSGMGMSSAARAMSGKRSGLSRAAHGGAAVGLGALGLSMVSKGIAGMNAGSTGVATYKKAEESMPKFAFKRMTKGEAMASANGMAKEQRDAKSKGQKWHFKKKADGEKTAGIATEGSLEGDRGSMSSAMARFLNIPEGDVCMAVDNTPDGDGGRR